MTGAWVPVALVVMALMEPWAALLHGRLWHGRLLWSFHRSHHTPRTGRFEKNDWLALVHVPPAMAAIIVACQLTGWTSQLLFGFGIGMTAFGGLYILIHDGVIHERLPVGPLARLPGMARIVAAHREHHRVGGAPFGLFLGPQELARRQERRRR